MPDPTNPIVDAPPSARRRALEGLGVAALCLVLNLAGNGRISLWDRDEPRYAGCTREMRASGDFLRPTFNGEPRYQKPVLIYWLMSAGMAVGGDNPFGARLASALAGAATCVLVWGFGARMFGPRVGLLAALVLATAPLAVINSKIATTDATLAMFLVACQFSLWVLNRRASTAAAAVFWSCLALATLTKGPVGPAMIAVSGLATWAMGGPRACWGRLRWRWGLLAFLLIAAPWYVAISILSGGDFLRVAVGAQIVQRVTSVMEQHPGFPGYYPATMLLTFYPWSALLPSALLTAWARRKGDPTLAFLLGWAIGPMILLECVRTKLFHYYLPAYPACALLVAWLVARLAQAGMGLRRWPMGRLGSGLLVGLGLSLTVVSLGAAMALPWALTWPLLALAAVLGAGTHFASESFRGSRPERAAHVLVASWSAILAISGAWLLPAAEPYRLSREVARKLAGAADRSGAKPLLMSFQEPSVVYEIGRPVSVMRHGPWLQGVLDRDGAVVSALSPAEMDKLSQDRALSLDVMDTIQGFNLSKGKSESLRVVLIRPAAVAARDRTIR